MFTAKVRSLLVVALCLGVLGLVGRPQEATQAEREAMYYRYLEFASYIRGGSIEPHWMRRPPLQEP